MSDKNGDWRSIRKASDGELVLARARWCSSFWCKFRGLMFRSPLPPDEGLLFVYKRENKAETTIHMLFMRFAITVIWLAADGTVVDKVLAKPWRLAYAPKQPAQYFIEASSALLERVAVGDKLVFEQAGEGVTV